MNEGKMTVNQYTNVKDIKETFLYTKNGYLMAYIKVNKINIALLRKEEKRGKSDQLAASFGEDRNDFMYVSYPREIDIDDDGVEAAIGADYQRRSQRDAFSNRRYRKKKSA